MPFQVSALSMKRSLVLYQWVICDSSVRWVCVTNTVWVRVCLCILYKGDLGFRTIKKFFNQDRATTASLRRRETHCQPSSFITSSSFSPTIPWCGKPQYWLCVCYWLAWGRMMDPHMGWNCVAVNLSVQSSSPAEAHAGDAPSQAQVR